MALGLGFLVIFILGFNAQSPLGILVVTLLGNLIKATSPDLTLNGGFYRE